MESLLNDMSDEEDAQMRRMLKRMDTLAHRYFWLIALDFDPYYPINVDSLFDMCACSFFWTCCERS